jgi:anti-sigma28 factor (negative regulator of flagellin synthesis)
MAIYELGPRVLGPDGPSRTRDKDDAAEKKAVTSVRPTERMDRVEISDEARAMATQGGASQRPVSTLSAERLEEIRERIDSGAYDTPEMAEEVARRLLVSGDL